MILTVLSYKHCPSADLISGNYMVYKGGAEKEKMLKDPTIEPSEV